MTTTSPRSRWRSAAAALPLVLVAGCGSNGGTADAGAGGGAASPGITDDTVVIGQTWPLTGAVAGAFGGIQSAITARIDEVNADGGVEMADGRTRRIEIEVLDDAFDPAKAVANVRQLVQQEEVFAVFAPVGTAQTTAITQFTEAQGVPVALTASAASTWGSPDYAWTIGFQPPSSVDSVLWADELTRTDPDARVAFLTDNSEFGAEAVSVFEDRLAELDSDVTVVAVQTYQTTDTTVDSQITALANSGADVFFNVATARQAAQAITAVAASSWRPQQILTSTSNGQAVVTAVGAAGMAGIRSTFFMKDPTDPQWADDDWMTAYRQTLADGAPDIDPDEQTNVFAVIIVDALVDALERTEEPTREAFMAALRSMDLADGGLLPGISATTGSDDPFPIESLEVGEFVGDRWELSGRLVDGEGLTPRPGA